MKKRKIVIDDHTIRFSDTQRVRDKVFESVVSWLTVHDSWAGECIMQCDDTVIGAPQLLCEIVDDILKPDVEYEGEGE